jgi:HSP20 family protein
VAGPERFKMEVMFESRWPNYVWLIDGANGFFTEFPVAVKHMVPPVDVIEDKDTYHFYLDMPGLKGDSLDARVEEGRLTIAAERKRPDWPNETEVRMAERGYGTIRRTFALPNDASNDNIPAGYKDGVLEVTVAKKPEAKSTKIVIN